MGDRQSNKERSGRVTARAAAVGRLWTFRVAMLLVGTLVSLVFLEVVLRILPVYGGFHRLPVNEKNPVARFEPDREFVWSRGWNFSIVNTVRINNFGFVSDFDYDPDETSPLLAVIGDSYVEAAMVPFPKTCAGRVAAKLDGTVRVYPFGVAGSPLTQYLAFAEYARDNFRPDGLVIVIVDNEYEQSLRKYGLAESYHQFVEQGGGRLVLQRNDFNPGFLNRAGRASALARYLVANVDMMTLVARVRRMAVKEERNPADAEEREPTLVGDSKRAVDAFLDMLPESSGLDPERIVFVVDGMRSDLYEAEALERASGSYLDVMRRYFMANAAMRGYETVDMQPVFIDHYRTHRERFEWPQDEHWNALGHEMCFDEVTRSELLSIGFPG